MSELVKVSTVNKNTFDLEIDYLLTFRCNYDCSYCISHDVNHPSLQRSSDEIIDACNFIFKQYSNKKIKLRILGGEPFVYKYFINLVNELSNYDFLQINIVTNLSVSEKTLQKLKVRENIHIAASYHPEFSDSKDFVGWSDDVEVDHYVEIKSFGCHFKVTQLDDWVKAVKDQKNL